MVLYRFARQHEQWSAAHPPDVIDASLHPNEAEALLPLGIGDHVRCRYRGGVRAFPATVIAVHWGTDTHARLPACYSVRYTADQVIEHDVPRACMTISQKAFTASLLKSPLSKVNLLECVIVVLSSVGVAFP